MTGDGGAREGVGLACHPARALEETTPRAADTPFVGRAAELRTLERLLARAASGAGAVVLLTGPAGIGKSTLVAEAVSRAERDGPPLRAGTGWCPPDGGAPPLWPWWGATAVLDSDQLSAALTELPDPTSTGPASDPQTLAAVRFQRLADVTRLLLRAVGARPAVLVLEDLHWADAPTMALLGMVAAEVARHPLLVVGTARDHADLHQVQRFPAVSTLPLEPLTVSEVAALLGPAPAAGPSAALVHERTGGVPLLVTVVARRGLAAPTPDLLDAVASMLSAVPEELRDVLRCAALVGLDPGLLSAACSTSLEEVLTALDAGRAAGLIAAPEGLERSRFAHALLQDGLRAAVPLHRVRAVHRAAGEHLGRRAEVDERLAATAAGHWAAAGDDPEALAQAARWSLVAGRRAMRALDPEDAVRHLTDAVHALRRRGAPDGEVSEALLALAEAQYLVGAYGDALRTCSEASTAARGAGRGDLVIAAALVVRWVTYREAAEIVTRLATAALDVPDVPDGVRGRLLAQLATMAAETARVEDAERYAVQALELAERDEDPLAVVDAARAREMTLVGADDSDERLRLGNLVVRHCSELGQPLGVVLGHQWRLRAAYQLARLGVVEDALVAIALVAERSGLALARWHHQRVMAAVAVLEGRFAAARAANTEAFALSGASGDQTAPMLTYAMAHRLAMLRGDPGELPDDFEDHMPPLPGSPLLLVTRAQLCLLLDRVPEAQALYERLVPQVRDHAEDLRWGAVVVHLVDLVEAFEDGETAAALLPQLEPHAAYPGVVGVPTVYFTGSPRREVGRLLAVMGRLDEAEEALRAAVSANTAVGARPQVVQARLDLAAVLRRRGRDGDLREAGASATAAAAEARRLDMPGPLARADLLLAELAAAERAASPLSARETEVADLVLQALSNRQIADRLVLSERTVESHVSAILRKAGVTSRTEYLARHAGTPVQEGPR